MGAPLFRAFHFRRFLNASYFVPKTETDSRGKDKRQGNALPVPDFPVENGVGEDDPRLRRLHGEGAVDVAVNDLVDEAAVLIVPVEVEGCHLEDDLVSGHALAHVSQVRLLPELGWVVVDITDLGIFFGN